MNRMIHVLFLALLFAFGELVSASRILVLHPFSPFSHHNIMSSIVDAIATRNHEITFVTMHRTPHFKENVHQIVLDQYEDAIQSAKNLAIQLAELQWVSFGVVDQFREHHLKACSLFFNLGLAQSWIKSEIKFDLVIGDAALNECLLPLYELMGDSVILVNTANLWPWISDAMNVPTPFSYVPQQMMPYTSHMTFKQRLVNSAVSFGYVLLARWFMTVVIDSYVRDNFRQARSYHDAINNVSLVLANVDPVFTSPRPTMPNIIPIGGIHCRPPKLEQIPQNLKTFIEGSGEGGFIMVSFGSIYNETFMPERKRNILVKAFSKLKQQRVLWKSSVPIDNVPSNVKVVSWFPQQDILGHPKLCAFFNHGGLLSLQEAIYNGIPTVSISLFGDQPSYVAQATELGITISLDWTNLDANSIASALEKACKDSNIKDNAKKYGQIFRDQPQAQSEIVVFWTEYVLRHQGTLHLRTAAHKLNFIQYFLLDVIGLIILVFLLLVFAIFEGKRRLFKMYQFSKLKMN